MYETNSLHRLSRHNLQHLYESDEEDASDSDAGGHDFVPSLVGSQRAAGSCDSDVSADETSHMDPDSDREDKLLAPYSNGKRPRPESAETIKRNSDATFSEDAYVFDPEEDMVLELPLGDPPAPMAHNLFLQPTICVSTESPPMNDPRSSSASSLSSVGEADIQVARQVTIMEPPTRPTLVFINTVSSRSKCSKSRSSHTRSRDTSESRTVPGKRDGERATPRVIEAKPEPSPSFRSEKPGSNHYISSQRSIPLEKDMRQIAPSATIREVSEVPLVPYPLSLSDSQSPTGHRARPRTSGAEKPSHPPLAARSRRLTESGRRPLSPRSTSSTSVRSSYSPFPKDEPRPGYMNEVNNLSLSRNCNPISVSAASPPPPVSSNRNHGSSPGLGPSPGTGASISHILGPLSPLMMRRMTRINHSTTSSIHSMSSLRSELDLSRTTETPLMSTPSSSSSYDATHSAFNNMNAEDTLDHPNVARKSSLRRHARNNSSFAQGGRGFMGLKFGRRAAKT